MVHYFLLPWLQVSLRHCYVGPWGAIATPSPQRRVRQRRAASTKKTSLRTLGSRIVGFLTPLPLDVAALVCRFVGHVREEDDSITLIANCEDSLQKARAVWKEAAARVNTPFRTRLVSWTSLGFHDEQLTPDEFVAYQTMEASANWDLAAEARRRPRPSQLHPQAEADDPQEAPSRYAADKRNFTDAPSCAFPECHPEALEQKPTQCGVHTRYAPLVRLQDLDNSIMNIVHRISAWKALDRRAGDRFLALKEFMRAHSEDYRLASTNSAVVDGYSRSVAITVAVGCTFDGVALAKQIKLRQDRKDFETFCKSARSLNS